ncbi:hypothetical protein, partial [Actinomadura violacea]
MADIVPRREDTPEPGDELSSEVRAWVLELNALWQKIGMSRNRFAAANPIDKGTLSRYLNGKRVPRDHWLLDRLLSIQAERGKAVSEEVREHLVDLQLNALKVSHPHGYQLRRISDELEISAVNQREAERYANSLKEQLDDRNRKLVEYTRRIDELSGQQSKLRAAWDSNRAELEAEIAELTQKLTLAREQARVAGQRSRDLERVLDIIEVGPEDAPLGGLGGISLESPAAVATLLRSLPDLDALTEATALAARAANDAPLDHPAEIAELLNAFSDLRLDNQKVALAARAAN